MKIFSAICALLLFVTGCAQMQTHQDSFASLYNLIQQTFADSCDCGPMMANVGTGRRYFENKPRARGLAIMVSERPFLTQKEWDKRYALGTNLMAEFLDMASTNYTSELKAAGKLMSITNSFGLDDLPEWHYQKIGVDVSIQDIEVVYPGYEQDLAEARKRHHEILELLSSYYRSSQDPILKDARSCFTRVLPSAGRPQNQR